MLQKNSFFSQPLVFFGAHEHNEEDEDEDLMNESINLLQNPWSQAKDVPTTPIPHIGLFLYWNDEIE